MPTLSKAKLQQFHHRLHAWYAAHGRHDLPWRNTRDAYEIYVSEVMLQQTQVQTVLSRFYAPFLAAFPNLQALADAPQEMVMKHWEGLGYYSRAANMHKAAKLAAPALPRNVEGLLALPGVGRNTANAVAAFAYGWPAPVMEANVKRVLCRVFAFESPVTEELWGAAALLLDKAKPFDYNQAMMDVGALVCTKRAPDCALCPLNEICAGKATPERYPAAKTKKPTPLREAHIIVWHDGRGKLHLSRRDTAFLGGLYGFEQYPVYADTVSLYNIAYQMGNAQHLGDVSQTYSHFKMNARVFALKVDDADGEGWFDAKGIASLALSGIDHKVLNLVAKQLLT